MDFASFFLRNLIQKEKYRIFYDYQTFLGYL